jgi:hypothetical protein
VLWAGIFEQVVGQMHKKVLKTMVMPLFYQKQPTFFVFSLQDYKKEERKEDDASVRSKMNIAVLIKVSGVKIVRYCNIWLHLVF